MNYLFLFLSGLYHSLPFSFIFSISLIPVLFLSNIYYKKVLNKNLFFTVTKKMEDLLFYSYASFSKLNIKIDPNRDMDLIENRFDDEERYIEFIVHLEI